MKRESLKDERGTDVVLAVCASDGLGETDHGLELTDSDSVRVLAHSSRVLLSELTVLLHEHSRRLGSELGLTRRTKDESARAEQGAGDA